MNTSLSYIYKNVVVTICSKKNGNKKINKPIATYLVTVYP